MDSREIAAARSRVKGFKFQTLTLPALYFTAALCLSRALLRCLRRRRGPEVAIIRLRRRCVGRAFVANWCWKSRITRRTTADLGGAARADPENERREPVRIANAFRLTYCRELSVSGAAS